jgi:hypothetical protein
MTDYDTDPGDCKHSDINVVGNPDPFGERMFDDSTKPETGFYRNIGFDAVCEDCGYRGNVVYRFERLVDFR